jgi:ABC-type amino acid transport substrate-binding protein
MTAVRVGAPALAAFNPLPGSSMRRLQLLVAVLLPAITHAQTTDKTLQRIRDSKAITIAYRTDAPPFSFEDSGQPAGYTVEICKRIVTSLEQQLKVQPLAVKWVPANVQTRLDLVSKGQVDLECGTTTATLSRMNQVDFSNPVWGPGGQKHCSSGRDSERAGAGGCAEEGARERQGRASEDLR